MGRSRFPGKPHKFHNGKRISVLLDTVGQDNECENITGCNNEDVERQNEGEGETSKEREKSDSKEGEEREATNTESVKKLSGAERVMQGRSEAHASEEHPYKMNLPKKTVTFGSVESCSDLIPNRKIPPHNMQPLVSIIKKKSAFKTTEQSALHRIIKPAKLTDLSSKSCVDFGSLRAKHNKSPPVKKSSIKFSNVNTRTISPPPEKDQLPRKFVLPSHSTHSSRAIKPNKRFIDNEEGLPQNPTPIPAPQPSAKVLKKPKLILSSDSNNLCYDEAYETCDSSTNSNDSSDSKHLDPPTNNPLLATKPLYLDKPGSLFGTSSLKNSAPSFQDTFVNGLKTVDQICDKVSDSDVNSCEGNSDSIAKLSKDQLKDGSSKTSSLLHLSRDTSNIPCPSDQSSSTSESSESEASVLSDSESEEDSDEISNRLTIVEKGHTQSQLLSGKVILREARLQLNSIATTNAGSEGPFSTFGTSNTSSGNSPGTVTCGVCGAVRFYRIVKQARKFGIYACESCRKFISKMMKRYGTLQNSPLTPLQCLNGDGNCRVPPILRSQEWKLLRCAYKTRCHACWLKLCLKSFRIPVSSKAALQLVLPQYMRSSTNVVQTVLPENTSPLRHNITPTTPTVPTPTQEKPEEPHSPASNKHYKPLSRKKGQEEEPKRVEDVDVPKNTEDIEDDSSSNRKRRHTRIKVRKKDKPIDCPDSDTTKRQKMELKGPRVKHVCRSASIVLGQPLATFPSSDDKEASDLSDDNSLSEVRKAEIASKLSSEIVEDTASMDYEEELEDKAEVLKVENVECKMKEEEIKEESTDSFDSMIFDNKENNEILTSCKNDSSGEDIDSKSSDEQTIESTLRKPKQPLAVVGNVRSQRLNQQINAEESISIDFWESYDPEEVCSTGWGIITSVPFSISSACYLCASKGKEKLVYCSYCCEPYHTFCVDGSCESNKHDSGWVCTRCEQCASCGGRGGATMACQTCRSKFHAACLAAGRAGQRADWPQICNACFKCKSCDSSKVTKFLGSLPFCQSCFKLRQKGNYCPLCQGCYQDNDFDSKMMECGWCSRWVHAQCEGLSGEGYQLLSALPPSVEYVCRQCQPHAPPWRSMITSYLRNKLKAVLKSMAKNRSACTLLKLTPHKITPNTKKPCVCSSPRAIRKLTFENKMMNSGSDLSSEERNKGITTDKDLSSDYLQASISKECIETAKGTVHKLQESLLQNNEIILSIGTCETKDRKTVDIKYNEQDRSRNIPTNLTPNDKDTEDDSDSSSSDTPITLLRSEKKSSSDKAECNTSDCKCACFNTESEFSSTSFLDVKRRVISDEYFSVKDFNGDMMEALSKSPEVVQVYKDIFTELFPWFDCESNCLNPSLEIEDENDDLESLKEEDISMITKNIPQDHTVPSLENTNTQPESMYDDGSLHETRICVLCKVLGEGEPSLEGRLLYCGQGDWIHSNCALWSAEVFEEIDGSLQNIQSAISRGRMINCAKCSNKGASVGCCAKNCSETYHFACARNVGCAFLDDKRVFCPQHVSEAENNVLQKEVDFDLARPVYVELDRKKKKYCDPQKVQFLLGSLVVKSLGRIIPSVSDFEDVLIPIDFLCTRLYWSTKEPWKIVKYTIRTKLLLVEPTPAYDLGVNITLDHSLNPSKVDRILAEINSWHKSLETKSHSLMVSKKDKSPIKFGSASVSLEDYAVKQVMEQMLDIVCRQDQQDDGPDEEPQNAADLLPPELKDAIFEDLNHDLLDGISVQDILPKLMSYEDFIALDLKNEIAFATDLNKESRSLISIDDGKKTNDDMSVVSNNNSDNWLDGKAGPQDLLEDIINSHSDSTAKDLKRTKSELLIQGEHFKSFANNKNRSLAWSCKLDGALSQTFKRCKLPRSGLLSRSDSSGNVVMVVDGTSDLLVSLAQTKQKTDSIVLEDCDKWESKPEKVPCNDSVTSELIINTLNNTDSDPITDPSDTKLDKVCDKHKSDESTEQVIDFYTKIHCSPISQLDGAADYSGQSDSESEAPMSPRDLSEVDFKPIHQLDGTDDMSSSSSDSGSPPRDGSTILFRPGGGDTQIAMTISPNLGTVSTSGELIIRSSDENVLRISQVEQTVRCDRCHCTYRTKDSFNRHLPNCDMMSTSESEGETPKSPDSRTLTTLQNAFNGSFIQPTFINQQSAIYENTEQFTCPKPGMVTSRRTSMNTRQITINGTIVEKQSPGPPSPLANDMPSMSQENVMSSLKVPKITISPNIMPQPQLMVSHVPISPIKNQNNHCPKTGILSTGGNFNICVKPNPGIQNIQGNNQTITQILPNTGNIQVLSSNPNQLLTISGPQQNVISSMSNKGPIIQNFSNIPSTQTITVPINSIQGMPSSLANNINSFVRPTISFQNAPTILMPTSCASRMASPNIAQKNQIFMPQNQKSPKKSPQVQPKPVFQTATKGRARALNKPGNVKRQNKMDKTMPNISPSLSLGPNGSVIQFPGNGSSGQPSIIVQQVSNPNIMSYVEALQQQQQQGANMQYIATITPQGEYKPPTQYISQIPQTFQIQQTENGGLVAVPSTIPVFLPQGGVGILPQTSLQPQSVTISPQGTIQTQGATILPQTALQTQNGTTILPQATIQTQNGTATIIPQGLTQGNIQSSGPTIVSASGIQPHNNTQTTLIPQSALQGGGNAIISQQGGATILPQGAILPQGLQFCNDQVILGSTPTLEMVTDSSGCMYLTTQPVYYGLETIVQNTVMSSQQFVSTAMQGVLAQNSSFSATTTQVFQASKIEPIVEMPAGYVVVNNVPQENIVVSQGNVNSQSVIPSSTIPTQATANSQNQKIVKSVSGPNITIQPSTDKLVTSSNNRQTIKAVSVQPNQPIINLSQPQLGTLAVHQRSIPSVASGKQNVTIQPLPAGVLHSGNVQMPNSSQLSQGGSFTFSNLPINVSTSAVSSANTIMNPPKVQIPVSINNTMEPIVNEGASNNSVRTSLPQGMWRASDNIAKANALSTSQSDSHVSTKIVPCSSMGTIQNISSSVVQTSVSNTRVQSSPISQNSYPESITSQTKIHHNTEVISNVPSSAPQSISVSTPVSNVSVSTSCTIQNSYVSGPQKDIAHITQHSNNMTSSDQCLISNIDSTNQSNKQMCNSHRHIPTSAESISVMNLPNNMMNLSVQNEKVYQLPPNSMSSTISNQQASTNQASCSAPMQFNNLHRNQSSVNVNNCNSQVMHNQVQPMGSNTNSSSQVHCSSSNTNGIMNSCSQHQNFVSGNQQEMVNTCVTQLQNNNSSNMQQMMMQQHNSSIHHMMGNNNIQHNVHINQNTSSNNNQFANQNTVAMNQQMIQNVTSANSQTCNQNNMNNQQVMMSQTSAASSQHGMMNTSNNNQNSNQNNMNSSQIMLNESSGMSGPHGMMNSTNSSQTASQNNINNQQIMLNQTGVTSAPHGMMNVSNNNQTPNQNNINNPQGMLSQTSGTSAQHVMMNSSSNNQSTSNVNNQQVMLNQGSVPSGQHAMISVTTNNQTPNQSNLNNSHVMLNQTSAANAQHGMMSATNIGNSNTPHMMGQNMGATNQQVMLNHNNMASTQQSFNINSLASNQQAQCNQQSLPNNAGTGNALSNNHQMMNHGSQHSMVSHMSSNMNMSNHHNIINQNMQMMNTNSQHQSNNQSCSNNQIMSNMGNQHSIQANQIQSHCIPMTIQNNSSNNSIQMYNQMHSMPSMMNICNINRSHNVGSNMNHHSVNLEQCNSSEMLQVNNMGERNPMQMSSCANNNMSNNIISNQIHVNSNQMLMGKNLLHSNPHCDVQSSNNSNMQYQGNSTNNDAMYMMSQAASSQGESNNMHHINNNFNQHQIQMNQSQMTHGHQAHMHPSPQVNKMNQDVYSKVSSHENVTNTMTMPHLTSENVSKMPGNVMNNNVKPTSQHGMLSLSPNHSNFSNMNNTGSHVTNFSERSHMPHLSNTSSPVTNASYDTNRTSQMTPLPSNDLLCNMDTHEMRSCSGETQNIEMPIIISNGSLTIPPLSNLMNKQNQMNSNSCMNPMSSNSISSNMISQVPMSQNLTNINSSQSNAVSLPAQCNSSINLPKAPTHPSGIPTNVVNPIPQSMRPMNRVLPIHRDAQMAKTIPKPKTRVEPPKPPSRSQDMPDLSIKEDEVIIQQQEVSKVESENKTPGSEVQKKTASVAEEISLPNQTPVVAPVKTESKPSELDNVNASFKILIQKKGQSGNVYKISTKSIKDKENLNADLCKIQSQKLDITKMAGPKLQNLPSIARKVSIRGKASLDNRSVVKSSKQSPKKVVKDDGPKLIYEITSEDGFSYSSSSLVDLWGKVLEAVQFARKQNGLSPLNYSLPQTANKFSGNHILGLTNNALKYLIEQLPGSNQCKKYKPQYGCKLKRTWQPDTEILRESPHGCARAGPVMRRSSSDTFGWLASQHRDPPLPLMEAQGMASKRFASTTLPMAMRFRHLKETSKLTVGVYRSHIHRRGLFCRRDIEAGEMVIEYAGEVIRAALADQREKKYEAARGGRGVNGCYMFRVDDHLVVDATMKGNAARFINHSCDPNCFSKVVDVLGHKHIIIFALRKINQGEELTYDYKFPFEEVKIPCTCGAKKCRKYLN